jgi:hypothetical protein
MVSMANGFGFIVRTVIHDQDFRRWEYSPEFWQKTG